MYLVIYYDCTKYKKKGSEYMKMFEENDIKDGKRIADIFATLSEENKNMAIVYLSALRDKEIADSSKRESS